MSKHPLVDVVIDLFDGVLVDDYGWEHHKIKGKKYDIRFDPSRIEWACDCPAFTYRYKFKKKYCNILYYGITKSIIGFCCWLFYS